MRYLAAILPLLLALPVGAQTTTRSENWTDVCTGGSCVRTLQTDINYYDEDADALLASEDSNQAAGPYTWKGETWTYRKRSKIYVHAGCTTCTYSTSIGARHDTKSAAWFTTTLLGVTAPWNVEDSRTLRWDFHANASYYVRAGRRTIQKVVAATGSFGQAYVEFEYKLPDTVVITPVNGGWELSGGNVTFTVRKSQVWDSENGNLRGPDPDGTLIDVVASVESNTTNGTVRTIVLRYTPDGPAVQAAWADNRTVYID